MRISDIDRAVVGAFGLFWADKALTALDFHEEALGLGHLPFWAYLGTSGFLSLGAFALWFIASFCIRAAAHYRLKRGACAVPGKRHVEDL